MASAQGPPRRRWSVRVAGAATIVGLGIAPLAATASAATAPTASGSSQSAAAADLAATASTSTELTLAVWKQRYEHDVGILADDVLVVVDDGKRAQTHITKAKVKTTVKDCRTWATDAAKAGTAAPPIPMAGAQRAWMSMIRASALAASDCLASLQQGSRHSATDFQKQLNVVEKDEVTLTSDLNG
jgi:hypothetical protein